MCYFCFKMKFCELFVIFFWVLFYIFRSASLEFVFKIDLWLGIRLEIKFWEWFFIFFRVVSHKFRSTESEFVFDIYCEHLLKVTRLRGSRLHVTHALNIYINFKDTQYISYFDKVHDYSMFLFLPRRFDEISETEIIYNNYNIIFQAKQRIFADKNNCVIYASYSHSAISLNYDSVTMTIISNYRANLFV